MIADKAREVFEEFRAVVLGRSSVSDSVLPPILFVVLNALLGLEVATWGALVLALLVAGARLARRQTPKYAFGGLGGIILAALTARVLGRAEGYFLPGIVTGIGTVLVALMSLALRRPMVAWTSYIARRWPWEWYWHPRVRPAYSEVTWLWVAFFTARSVLKIAVFQSETVELLALTNFLTGWPATITLLVASYLYGTWRLQNLKGPSVKEFEAGAKPPWTGQRRGF
jgi:hypothetical protein